jgi:tetratricopeptide (TPR) repeat protein
LKGLKEYFENTLGICFYKLNKFELALKYLLKNLEKHQSSSTLLCIFDILDKQPKRTTEGLNAQIKCLQLIINDEPENIDYKLKLGKLYIELKDYNSAIDEFKKVLELNPKTFYAMFELTCLYIIKKDYKNLAKLYLKIGNMLKEGLANETYDINDPNSTINICLKYYIEAQKLMPNNIDIVISLADLLRILDRHKEAIYYINLALQMNKDDYNVYYYGFLIYDEIGDFHNAKEMLKTCLLLNIGFLKGYNAFGNVLRKEKLYADALKVFETALIHDDNNTLILNNYANCLLEMGNKKKAKEIYLRAYHIDNSLPDVNSNLATIYRKESKYIY